MTAPLETIIYPVKDLALTKALFSKVLGVKPAQDEAYYVGFDLGGQSLGLDPNGHAKGMTGPVSYWQVPDIEAAVRDLVAAGATVQQETRDVGGGKLIAVVTDADGNGIGLTQNP
ncbi:VOC family protein [Streptomyces odontomachi]|uniref:VOC family protein n=1 Tax=Streptomyces odontomachi TaxID=2944940 RepID=UPI002108C039|nr:VOC family protein [Streptomyces sp. ODS25]